MRRPLTITCPACGYGFLNRRRLRCVRCGVHLYLSGEYIDPTEEFWVWIESKWVPGEEWMRRAPRARLRGRR